MIEMNGIMRLIVYCLIQLSCIYGDSHRPRPYTYETEISDPDHTLVRYRVDKELIVTSILIEPYTMRKSGNTTSPYWQANHQNQLYEGYIVDLLDKLSQVIGFSYRLVPTTDGQFGYKNPDGTWNGMVGELVHGRADMAAAPMFITDQRDKVIDFSRPYMTVGASILFRRPPDGIPPEVESVHDLVGNPYVDYGTLNRGIIRRSFRFTNVSLYREMWNHMKTYQQYLLTETNEEGIQRVRKENYAFILPTTIAEYISRKRPCDLMVIDNFLMREGYGLAVPLHSTLLPHLNQALDSLERSGFLKSIYDKWWIHSGECNPVSEGRVLSLSGAAFGITPKLLPVFTLILMCLFTTSSILLS